MAPPRGMTADVPGSPGRATASFSARWNTVGGTGDCLVRRPWSCVSDGVGGNTIASANRHGQPAPTTASCSEPMAFVGVCVQANRIHSRRDQIGLSTTKIFSVGDAAGPGAALSRTCRSERNPGNGSLRASAAGGHNRGPARSTRRPDPLCPPLPSPQPRPGPASALPWSRAQPLSARQVAPLLRSTPTRRTGADAGAAWAGQPGGCDPSHGPAFTPRQMLSSMMMIGWLISMRLRLPARLDPMSRGAIGHLLPPGFQQLRRPATLMSKSLAVFAIGGTCAKQGCCVHPLAGVAGGLWSEAERCADWWGRGVDAGRPEGLFPRCLAAGFSPFQRTRT